MKRENDSSFFLFDSGSLGKGKKSFFFSLNSGLDDDEGDIHGLARKWAIWTMYADDGGDDFFFQWLDAVVFFQT